MAKLIDPLPNLKGSWLRVKKIMFMLKTYYETGACVRRWSGYPFWEVRTKR